MGVDSYFHLAPRNGLLDKLEKYIIIIEPYMQFIAFSSPALPGQVVRNGAGRIHFQDYFLSPTCGCFPEIERCKYRPPIDIPDKKRYLKKRNHSTDYNLMT